MATPVKVDVVDRGSERSHPLRSAWSTKRRHTCQSSCAQLGLRGSRIADAVDVDRRGRVTPAAWRETGPQAATLNPAKMAEITKEILP